MALDVKEISQRLEVSKKTIYKYLKKYDEVLKPFLSTGDKNQKVLNEKGYNLLLKFIDKPEENKSNDKRYIELLERQIEDLKKDKEDLKADKDQLNKLLDQQQQLHLKLQNNIKLLEVNADSHKENNQSDVSQEGNQQKEPQGLFEKLKDIFR